MTKLDLPKDIIKLCANSICNNAHLDGQLRQENVEHCIETLLGPYLSLPKQEVCKICGGLGEVENHKAMHAKDQFAKCRGCSQEQEDTTPIEKIDWRICELSVTGQHTKYTHDTEGTIQLLLDTVNKQQEQINSLISKQTNE